MTEIKPPTEKQYEHSAIQQAFSFCPTIYPCAKCGWPVVSGYCCPTCGTDNPGGTSDD